jgi:hypothetical protein
MARFVARTLLALAVLCLGAVLFYRGLGPTSDPSKAPPTASAPPPPTPAPPTVPPPPPPPPPGPPPPADPLAADLARVADLLTRAEADAKALRASSRDGGFETRRVQVLRLLGEAREILNRVLDAHPSHRRANDLWTRLQQVQNAVRHL